MTPKPNPVAQQIPQKKKERINSNCIRCFYCSVQYVGITGRLDLTMGDGVGMGIKAAI